MNISNFSLISPILFWVYIFHFSFLISYFRDEKGLKSSRNILRADKDDFFTILYVFIWDIDETYQQVKPL